MAQNKNFFIVFEGIDGSGKTTQARLLYEKLLSKNYKVILTSEPTDNEIGKLIRSILNGNSNCDYLSIAALFVADRLEHLKNKTNGLEKYYNEGFIIICDRYYLSNYAYNSMHVSIDWLIDANNICREILKPDLNIFIDVNAEISMKRLAANREEYELFEKSETLNTVRNNYFKTFEKLKDVETIEIIDGNRPVIEIENDVWKIIEQKWKLE
ncbi:MAG: dTMP kinase [Bacteroidetes bacterium]|nr:dTMP kinase [Bacteroidota bacterium]